MSQEKTCVWQRESTAIIVFFLGLLLAATPSVSAERPKVGLVLGGGGAKGAAHIGVLKVLEEAQVPIDAIAGTSFGAVVGSLYASGYSAAEIDEIARRLDWVDIFNDSTARNRRNFRRKQDDVNFLTKFRLSFEDGQLALPGGLIQGQKLFLEISQLLERHRQTSSFDKLPIPFRAVAADLKTGEAVVLKDGDLATAVFASMAVPGFLPPVRREGLTLVDGGIANNVPVNVARAMGVDVVIVVTVGAKSVDNEEPESFVDVLAQLTSFLGSSSTKAQLESLGPNDIWINADTPGMSLTSFTDFVPAIQTGVSASQAHLAALEKLGLTNDEWLQHRRGQASEPRALPMIEFIEITQDSTLSNEALTRQLNTELGQPLEPSVLRRDLDQLYATDTFRSVTYDIINRNGQTGLGINAKRNPLNKDFFKFGLLLETDFEADTSFALGASYTKRDINPWGGEWRSTIAVGSVLGLQTGFYQPLGPKLNYFVEPIFNIGRESELFFLEDAPPIQARNSQLGGSIAAGRLLGNWGELRLEAERLVGSLSPEISGIDFDTFEFDITSLSLGIRVDTLDNLSFPTRGLLISSIYTHFDQWLGGDFQFDELDFRAFGVVSWGRNNLRLGGRFQASFNFEDDSLSGFALGGFLNLPGFAREELFDEHVLLGQAIYYRRLNEQMPFFDLPLYVGGSFETGNTFGSFDEIAIQELFAAGSVFLGADTPLGPIFLGTGGNSNGNVAFYLFIGQSF